MKYVTILFISLIFLTAQPVMAQPQAGGGEDDVLQSSLMDMTTVVAIGGAGAVLGLSTLSFVEEPKDHLKNILVGGSVGIIIGVAIVAYKQAASSKDMYYEDAKVTPDFKTLDRTAWHSKEQQKLLKSTDYNQSQLGYSFTF
ncbi:MAG: hypothetical protein KC493_00610 [Bacteriovoracaceae bacterium]|nr:hypothetical protein [Bacteriovoracaceae bacterium]